MTTYRINKDLRDAILAKKEATQMITKAETFMNNISKRQAAIEKEIAGFMDQADAAETELARKENARAMKMQEDREAEYNEKKQMFDTRQGEIETLEAKELNDTITDAEAQQLETWRIEMEGIQEEFTKMTNAFNEQKDAAMEKDYEMKKMEAEKLKRDKEA
jgi:hypothetical protein